MKKIAVAVASLSFLVSNALACSLSGYQAEYKFSGDAHGTIKQDLAMDQDGQYEMTSVTVAKKFIFSDTITEKTKGNVVSNQLVPTQYSATDTLSNNPSTIEFAQGGKSVTGVFKGQKHTINTPMKTYDGLSYPLALRAMLNQQPKASQFTLHTVMLDQYHKPQALTMVFKRVGVQNIKTPLGTFTADQLQTHFKAEKKTSVVNFWFVPKLNNLMVKSQTKVNGEVVANANLVHYTLSKSCVLK